MGPPSGIFVFGKVGAAKLASLWLILADGFGSVFGSVLDGISQMRNFAQKPHCKVGPKALSPPLPAAEYPLKPLTAVGFLWPSRLLDRSPKAALLCQVGASPSGKASVFGIDIPRFESWRPSQFSPCQIGRFVFPSRKALFNHILSLHHTDTIVTN